MAAVATTQAAAARKGMSPSVPVMRPRGMSDADLSRMGLPRAYGLVFMLTAAGGLIGCVRCQRFPFPSRSSGERSQ